MSGGKDRDPIWSGLAYGGLGFGALAVASAAFAAVTGYWLSQQD